MRSRSISKHYAMPRFSIIIATYNQLDLLKVCLGALEEQSFKDFDVHICDDGSTDGTREYFENDGRIQYHYQKNKGNFGMNLNQAIGKAQGQYLVFIAADSFPEKDYLEILDHYVDEDRIVCGIRVQIAEVGGTMQGVDLDWRLKKEVIPPEAAVVMNQPWGRLTGNGLTVPASAFALHGKFREDLAGYGGDDNELIARLYFKGYVCWSVPELRLYHHWHIAKDAPPGKAKKVNELFKQYAA